VYGELIPQNPELDYCDQLKSNTVVYSSEADAISTIAIPARTRVLKIAALDIA